MKPIYHPFAIVALFIICIICAILIALCMMTDWICKPFGKTPFGIINSIQQMENQDNMDGYEC